jgi:hypothetical protein
MVIELITLALLAQQPLPSVIVPPSNERAIVFVDRGRTYHVGMASGSVLYFDTLPGPSPVPIPPIPPTPPSPSVDLTGFPLTVYKHFTEVIRTDTAQTAAGLGHALDVTLAKAGGLSLGTQAILDDLAATIEQLGLRPNLAGFQLGDLLKASGATTREALIQALKDVKTAIEAVK